MHDSAIVAYALKRRQRNRVNIPRQGDCVSSVKSSPYTSSIEFSVNGTAILYFSFYIYTAAAVAIFSSAAV